MSDHCIMHIISTAVMHIEEELLLFNQTTPILSSIFPLLLIQIHPVTDRGRPTPLFILLWRNIQIFMIGIIIMTWNLYVLLTGMIRLGYLFNHLILMMQSGGLGVGE